jgi:transposase InsO family protein
MKTGNQPKAGLLHPLEVPQGPWQDISADFTTDLPLSNGFDSILVVVDRFSKETVFIPCNKTETTLSTAKLFLNHVWKNHGLPTSIVSDRGPQFASAVMQEVCKRLGINSKLSTAFHPQTDGQTERMNRDLQQYLRLFCAEKQDQWADWLAIAQFSYNSKMQTSSKKTPFEVSRNYVPRMGIEQRVSKAPAAKEFADDMANTLEEVKNNLKEAQGRQKIQADKKRAEAPIYSPGDKVWLATENLRLTRASKKLTEKWIGPFPVIEMVGSNAVKLKLPRTIKIHPVVNISRIKPYKERLTGQPVVAPGPLEVTEDRDVEWEVDFIVDSRLKRKTLEYLVHWKGYSDEDRTWEPAGNLKGAPDAISEFHTLHPNAPRKLTMQFAQFERLFNPYDNLTSPDSSNLPYDRLEVDP